MFTNVKEMLVSALDVTMFQHNSLRGVKDGLTVQVMRRYSNTNIC